MADAKDAKTAKAVPTLRDTEAPVGTIQMRPDAVVDQAPAVMPTVTGTPVPVTTPPSIPPPRYELGPEIARGGMGRVVEATDTLLGRVVALKEALALDAEALRRFTRETRITARLEHPSIVPVHDAGTMVGGAPYYVMRKISGRPLERLVATGETLGERLALIPHIVAAAQAVAHAHARGIVHRDIKPSNILVGDLGETIVIDWGLAKVIGEADDLTVAPPSGRAPTVDPTLFVTDDIIKTRAGIVFGTPGFMAPEQLRGAPVTERCDVYALGATLYHLLSRKPPHHARTADEMMKAAAQAPPPSIGELVFGVPAELTTIVDKALAHDPDARYKDARALAEDLQRFLTGQLVASHRYTPRERLLRFTRKHRVPVMAIGGALLALVVIGSLAVVRVIGERDRADEAARNARKEQLEAVEQRTRAEDRADKLTLTQARSRVTSNPTEALAMIKPLAAKHWREVRSIASAARASGVAWSLEASKRTSTLEMSRDGLRALAAGDDGVVRLYDLAHRSSRKLAERGVKVSARFADTEHRVVVWAGKQLVVLDERTGARVSELITTTAIRDLEIVGVTAYWIDEHSHLWHLDLAGVDGRLQPLEIPLDEPVTQIAPSPDGRWIALYGDTHVMLHDRTQPGTPPENVTLGRIRDLDWSADGGHFVALVDMSSERGGEAIRVIDVQMTPVPSIIHTQHVGNRQFVAYSNGLAYTIGPTGVGISSRNETAARKQLLGDPVGVSEAFEGSVVAGSQGGIAVLTDDGDHTLFAPTSRLDIVEASPRSPYVLATIEGRLLVWNLSEVLPRRLATRAPTFEQLVGNDHVFASFLDNTAEWIDLATRKSKVFAQWPSTPIDIEGASDGRAICTIDIGRRARLVVEGHEPEDLDGHVDVAGFATDNQLLLGTKAGTLQLYDLQTKRRTALIARQSQLIDIAWSRTTPAWVAAVFADGTLWRKNLTSGLESTSVVAVAPPQLLALADGSVVFPDTRTLRTWRIGGAVEPLVTLPKPIVAIGLAGATAAVAFTDDGSSSVVKLELPDVWTESMPLGRTKVALAPDAGLIVAADRGGIDILDPIVNHRWTLASSAGLTFNAPKISNDGRHVIARRVATNPAKRDAEGRFPTTLLVWDLGTPTTPDELSNWLDTMTNAIVDPQSPGGIGWQ